MSSSEEFTSFTESSKIALGHKFQLRNAKDSFSSLRLTDAIKTSDLTSFETPTDPRWARQAPRAYVGHRRYTVTSKPSTPTIQNASGDGLGMSKPPMLVAEGHKLAEITGNGYVTGAHKLSPPPSAASIETQEQFTRASVRRVPSSKSQRSRYPPSSWRDRCNGDIQLKQVDERRYSYSASPPLRSDIWANRYPDYFDAPRDDISETQNPSSFERVNALACPKLQEIVSSPETIEMNRLMQPISLSRYDHGKAESDSDFSVTSQDESDTYESATCTYSLSTISAAPTPFSSPLTSPSFDQFYIQQGKAAPLSVAAQASSTYLASNELPSLPSPDTAYSQVSYYTECPHSSPPFPRPLDVQPMSVTLPEGFNKIPGSFERIIDTQIMIQEEPMSRAQTVSILLGACPNCDLMYRRQKESEIISKYDVYIHELRTQNHLQGLQNLNLFEHEDADELYLYHRGPHRSQQTVNLTVVMGRLLEQRDNEVRNVWKGLTQRWGPGLLGIYRQVPNDITVSRLTRPDIDDNTGENTQGSSYSSINDRILESVATTSDRATISNATNGPSRASSISGGRAINIRGSNNVDGVIDDGRMRIEWIRPHRNV